MVQRTYLIVWALRHRKFHNSQSRYSGIDNDHHGIDQKFSACQQDQWHLIFTGKQLKDGCILLD